MASSPCLNMVSRLSLWVLEFVCDDVIRMVYSEICMGVDAAKPGIVSIFSWAIILSPLAQSIHHQHIIESVGIFHVGVIVATAGGMGLLRITD